MVELHREGFALQPAQQACFYLDIIFYQASAVLRTSDVLF